MSGNYEYRSGALHNAVGRVIGYWLGATGHRRALFPSLDTSFPVALSYDNGFTTSTIDFNGWTHSQNAHDENER